MDEMPDNIRKEIWDNFEEFQMVFLGTAEGNIPRVRPVTLGYLEEKFWIFTGTNDAKVTQIKGNPKVEIAIPLKKDENNGYVRAYGDAKLILDDDTRKRLYDQCPFIQKYFKTSDDPGFTLLNIEMEEMEYLKPGEFEAAKYSV